MAKRDFTLYTLLSLLPGLLCAAWLVVFFPALRARSCEVPVFSYAMQYWDAAPYRVTVFHDAPLSAEEENWLAQFKNLATHESLETNLEIHVFDGNAQKDTALLEMRHRYLKNTSTGVLVQYPVSTGKETPVFAGLLSGTLLGELVESPARNSIIADLVSGKVAVWVLLESGNRRADNAAAATLEKELRRMEQVLPLPDIDFWAWSDTLRENMKTDAAIRFPVLRVSREAPDEWFFVQSLLRSEPDLQDKEDSPIVFPIYGRGLILYALVGAGINEWTIAEACEFIVGPCSCFAKASNPGTDLLLSANWAQHIGGTRYDKPASLAGFSDFFLRGEIAAAQLATQQDEQQGNVPDNSGGIKNERASEKPCVRFPIWQMTGLLAAFAIIVFFFCATYLLVLGKDSK